MLSHPLKLNCYLALIEKRHYKLFYNFIQKNRDYYQGILHFIEKINAEEDAKNFIVKSLSLMVEGEMVCWGIWNNGKVIGEVSVRDINEEFKSAEIAYFIDKDYEGKGIISQACEILLEYVFSEFDIQRIELGCDVNNNRSKIIANKFGFVFEGISRKGFIADGKLIDCNIYSLLRGEYLENKNKK